MDGLHGHYAKCNGEKIRYDLICKILKTNKKNLIEYREQTNGCQKWEWWLWG